MNSRTPLSYSSPDPRPRQDLRLTLGIILAASVVPWLFVSIFIVLVTYPYFLQRAYEHTPAAIVLAGIESAPALAAFFLLLFATSGSRMDRLLKWLSLSIVTASLTYIVWHTVLFPVRPVFP